jgi:hypothetical protein
LAADMELLLFIFFAVVVLAAVSGRVTDSRDFADWRPTCDGERCSPR